MFEGYIVPIIIAAVVLAGLSFAFSKSLRRTSDQSRASLPESQAVSPASRQREESSRQTAAPNENAELIAKLYRDLMHMCLHDEAKVQRLIGFERKRNPNAGLAVLIQDAINRLIDDNR